MRYLTQSDVWRLDQIMKAEPVKPSTQSRVVARFHQVFPLVLFPDEIIIEELRVVWINKSGPWMNKIVSTMATDIACVNANTGPFFGDIHIQSLTGGPEIMVDKLARADILLARSLIEGIAMAAREGLKIASDSINTERANLLQAGTISTRFI